MTMETLGGDAASESDDLRAQLESAFRGETAPAEPEVESLDPAEDDDPLAAQAAADRARDERGRFAKAEEAPAKAATAPEATATPQVEQPVPEASQGQELAIRPPPGWSPAAKVAFDKLPAEVQQAVAKREDEVNRGFAKLAEYKPVEPYIEMARQSGTTLDKALQQYTQIENLLHQDPIAGIKQICQNAGINLAALASQLGSPQAHQQAPQTAAPAPEFQKLTALEQTVQRLVSERHEAQQKQIDGALESFFSDPAHKFASNVQADMVPLIERRRASNPAEPYGESLKWAYEKAVWANDETRPLLLNEQIETRAKQSQVAANQARAAAKSLTGSPTPGASTGNEPAPSLREELERQFSVSRV